MQFRGWISNKNYLKILPVELSSCNFVKLIMYSNENFDINYNILASILTDLQKPNLSKKRSFITIYIYFPGITFRELSLMVDLKVNLNDMLCQAYSSQTHTLIRKLNIAKCNFQGFIIK